MEEEQTEPKCVADNTEEESQIKRFEMEEGQADIMSATDNKEEENPVQSTQENEAEQALENALLREPLKAAPTRNRFRPSHRPPTETSSGKSG